MSHVRQRCFGLYGLVACGISVNVGCMQSGVMFLRVITPHLKDEEHFRLCVGHYLVSSTGDAG